MAILKNRKFSFRNRLRSFKYAFNGMWIMIKEEHNFRIHIFAAVCVIGAGLLFDISAIEWIAVFLVIGLVISLEIINSAIERLSDYVSPEKNNKIKAIKDLAAASVLVGAVVALIVGIIIFIPKILKV